MAISDLRDATDAAQFGSKAARLSALMRAGFRVPDGICISAESIDDPAIPAAVARLAPPFAVRSSGLNEDSGVASFAGQFETFLNVDAAGVPDAVRRCAESGRSDRVSAYARVHGIEAGGTAVLVQRMIAPEWAGVLFTANPVTQNLREMVVNAAAGLGDQVAAGTVKPRSLRIDRDGRNLGPDALEDALLRELARAGREIERVMAEPADIEWAWLHGELHILQARPITNIVRYPTRTKEYSNVYVWTNVNFAETMAKPVSPLGWSLMESAAQRTFGQSLRVRNDAGYRLFDFLFGRVYWNLTIFFGSPLLRRLMSDSLESLSPPLRAEFDRLAASGRVRPRPIFTLAQKLVLLVQAAFLVPWMALRMAITFITRPGLEDLEARMRARDGSGSRDLARAMQTIVRDAADDLRCDYMPSFLLSLVFFGLYMRLAPRLLGVGAAEALDLVTGEPDLTTQSNLALMELARLRMRSPAEFPAAFARHLEKHGHRGPNEQDVYYPRLAERPELALALIENCQRAPDRRRAARASVPWFLEPLRRLTARWLPMRENGKHYLMLAFHRVRRLALRLGAQLHAEGRLRAADDVFFLTIDELGRLPAAAVIESRKADFRRYATVRAPLLVTSDGGAFSITAPPSSGNVLRGDAASAGVATGRVRVIRDPGAGARIEPGEILVAPHTDPGWTPLFLTAAALVTEVGGIISHGAVVARELGLPAVVNVADATTLLRDGEMITVDGSKGEVRRSSQ